MQHIQGYTLLEYFESSINRLCYKRKMAPITDERVKDTPLLKVSQEHQASNYNLYAENLAHTQGL